MLELLASGKAQEASCRALGRLASENLENQREIVKLNGIPKLLPPLSGVNTEAQVQAAAAIAAIAGGERNRSRQNAIAKAGGIRPVLALVESRYAAAKCMAMHALAQLAMNNIYNQDAVMILEGLPPLVLIVSSGSSTPDVQMYAARAIAELVKHNHKNQTIVAELGIIGLLVSLLRNAASTKSPEVEAEVAGAMQALSEGNQVNQLSIGNAGAIPVLVGLLGSRSDHTAHQAGNALASLGLDNSDGQREMAKLLVNLLTTAKREATQERAAAALWRLVRQNPFDQQAIASAGGAQPLVKLLRVGPVGGRAFALWSLSLCIDEKNQAVVVEAGAIEPLVELLSIDDFAINEQAAGALNKLATSQTVAEIGQAGAIAPLITLLDSSSIGSVREFAAGALSALALRDEHRGAIERAGGVSPLVALLTDPLASDNTKTAAALALGLLSVEEGDTGVASTSSVPAGEPGQDGPGSREPASAPAPAPTPDDDSYTSGRGRRGSLKSPEDGGMTTSPDDPVSGGSAHGRRRRNSFNAQPAADSPAHSRSNAVQRTRAKKCRVPRKIQIADEGAIAPLVALLSKDGASAQEEAAGALKAMADNAVIRLAITESGGIGPLVALLGGSNPKARENAEGALVRLSLEMANRVLIIQQLVAMLYKEDIAAREQAAAAIANLAHESTANCISIVEAGGIPPLLALLESDSGKAKENSASAIAQLARGSRPNQNAITRAGGIPLLVAVLTSSSSSKGDASAQHLDAIITHSIWMLAKKNFANQVALAEAGVITPLVSMLGNASVELQLPATGVIECLLQSRDIQAAIVRTGAIAPLCTLSRDGSLDTQEQAAAALWSLAKEKPVGDTPETAAAARNSAMANRTTIAKLGGVESLVKMFVTGGSEKSQKNAAGALSSIASRNPENRAIIAKRIVNQLNSKVAPDVAARTLTAITRMCGLMVNPDDSSKEEVQSNQTTIAKLGGVMACITWLGNTDDIVQQEAAHALLAMSTNNYTTQQLISRAEGLEGLISVIRVGCVPAQEHAASTLWHLCSDEDSQQRIADADGIAALVSMLEGSSERGAELAAVTIVRLAQGNSAVSVTVAEVGGIRPLVRLLDSNSGAAQQAAATLAELSLVARNRDPIANAGGIEPLIELLSSRLLGTPETAARALAYLARGEGEDTSNDVREHKGSADSTNEEGDGEDDEEKLREEMEEDEYDMHGAEERRGQIMDLGGVEQLITMLDGSNLSPHKGDHSAASLWKVAREVVEEVSEQKALVGAVGAVDVGISIGMQEQAAAALSEFANGDTSMQDAIIEGGGVPKLLAVLHEGKGGNLRAQEHAASTLWHLSTAPDNQAVIIKSGCVPELVSLVKTGSPKAQEVAVGALSNIARGSGHKFGRPSKERTGGPNLARRRGTMLDVSESLKGFHQRESLMPENQPPKWKLSIIPMMADSAIRVNIRVESKHSDQPVPVLEDTLEVNAENPKPETDNGEHVGHTIIAECHGIQAIVALMTERNATPLGKENAASALWHLARDPESRDQIAQCNGIAPLVSLLKDGTHKAHRHASDALARLANQGRDHQSQIAKKLSTLLMPDNSTTVQQRAAHALRMLAVDNPGSHNVIVKAGAISPLVYLLSTVQDVDVKKAASDALETLIAGAGNNEAAVADLTILLGTGSMKAQELVAQLLLTLCADEQNKKAIGKSGAIQKLVNQLSSSSTKVQEMSAAVLSALSEDSAANVATITKCGGVQKAITLLTTPSAGAHLHAAAILADLTKHDDTARQAIVDAKGIGPLVELLSSGESAEARAEAAGALGGLCDGHDEITLIVVQTGAIEPLVYLLKEENRRAQRKAASALAVIVAADQKYQTAVSLAGGIPLLVNLLADASRVEVQAHAASSLARLVEGNVLMQTAFAKTGGIPLLISMLQESSVKMVVIAAARALRNVTANHTNNRNAVTAAGGILTLVMKVACESVEVQTEAAQTLCNLTSKSPENQVTISTLLVKLLNEKSNQESPERAARAIAQLARGGTSSQDAVARVGAIGRLLQLLQQSVLRIAQTDNDEKAQSEERDATNALQQQVAAALRSLAKGHLVNQKAISSGGGLPLLISVLKFTPPRPIHHSSPEPLRVTSPGLKGRMMGGLRLAQSTKDLSKLATSPTGKPVTSPLAKPMLIRSISLFQVANDAMAEKHKVEPLDDAQREAAGALWNMAGDQANTQLIVDEGGIPLLLELVKSGSRGAQETATGALCCMAASSTACKKISEADPIDSFEVILDKGIGRAKEQAAGILQRLANEVPANRIPIAKAVVRVLSSVEPGEDLECVAQLSHDLSLEVGPRNAMVAAGAVPHLVKQIETGTDKACEAAAKALGELAKMNNEAREDVTHELISARHAAVDKATSLRVAKALSSVNTDTDNPGGAQKALGFSILFFRMHTRDDAPRPSSSPPPEPEPEPLREPPALLG